MAALLELDMLHARCSSVGQLSSLPATVRAYRYLQMTEVTVRSALADALATATGSERIEVRDHGQNAAMVIWSRGQWKLAENAPHMLLNRALRHPELVSDTGV